VLARLGRDPLALARRQPAPDVPDRQRRADGAGAKKLYARHGRILPIARQWPRPLPLPPFPFTWPWPLLSYSPTPLPLPFPFPFPGPLASGGGVCVGVDGVGVGEVGAGSGAGEAGGEGAGAGVGVGVGVGGGLGVGAGAGAGAGGAFGTGGRRRAAGGAGAAAGVVCGEAACGGEAATGATTLASCATAGAGATGRAGLCTMRRRFTAAGAGSASTAAGAEVIAAGSDSGIDVRSGPSRRPGSTRRPPTTATTRAAAAPWAKDPLMFSPDQTDNDSISLSARDAEGLNRMGSFKFKLVLWFALLALVPLAVAYKGYETLANRSETRRADAALEAGLRAAVAGYGSRLEAASAAARSLASDPALQQALRARDRRAVALLARRHPNADISLRPRGGAVSVLDDGRVLGSVRVDVTVDDALLGSIDAGLSSSERLVAARGGRIVAGVGNGESLSLAPGRAGRVRLAGIGYRGLATEPFAHSGGLVLAALVPQRSIDAAVQAAEARILTVLLASLLLFTIVSYLLARSVVSTLRRLVDAANAIAHGHLGERVEVQGRDEFAQVAGAFNHMAAQLEQRLVELETERNRVRGATVRFGEAMMATHDPAQLVRIVVESAVEATGAVGGVVIDRNGVVAVTGDPDASGDRIAFPLRLGTSDFGSLVLTADSIDAEQVETAASLAAQVVVALENARLHRIVERQAMVDSLTGLANRRSLEETLRAELARASRFGDSVCVVLADLDHFKRINDRFGHAVGDEVLRAFADALRQTVRESDVAGRWGGEEFALVLPGTDAVGGARLAERARAVAAEVCTVTKAGEEATVVTASFGVASYPECDELGELLAAADSALYAAKREGRNRVVAAPESTQPKIV
jgi:diguanylate cyclase (GGDEF)-like protein